MTPSPRERAVMEEVLDRINGCPPIYMEELDGWMPDDGDDVRWETPDPPATAADDVEMPA